MNSYRPLNDVISQDNKNPMIISHRGDWRYMPENSIAAVLLAVDAGADMVEIDTQCTNQGMLYLMHDDTTDRTTNRKGATRTLKEDEFGNVFLRVGEGSASAAVTQHPVPTLAEALETARGRVHLNIDTKHRCDLEAVGNLVFKMGMEDQVLIKMSVDAANPDLSILQASWFGRLNFMPVMLEPHPGRMALDAVRLIQLYDANILEVSFLSLEELAQTSDKMQEYGVRLWCNTLNSVHPLDFSDNRAQKNPDQVWGTLLRHGVGAIQTDKTEELKSYLTSKK